MGNEIEVSVETITPGLAEEYLRANTHNRALRERTVDAMANDMANGDWTFNGESIKFDCDGALSDGQHRLKAIVQADVTVPCVVVRGLEPEAQDTVDSGIGRKLHDILKLRGEPNALVLAAIVRLVALWKADVRYLDGGSAKITNPQCLRTLEEHPELRDIARRAGIVAVNSDLPASIAGLCMWLFEQIDKSDSDFFFERLTSELGHSKGEAIYELRRTLTAQKENYTRAQRKRTWIMAITIKAWNAFRDGDPVSLYKFRGGGSRPEQFPEPH